MDAATGWCEGCLRTIEEIASWGAMDDAGRRTVLSALPARRVRRRMASAAAPPVRP
jgi:uncharacterized protein